MAKRKKPPGKTPQAEPRYRPAKFNPQTKRWFGRSPKTGHYGFITPEDAAWAQREWTEALAQIEIKNRRIAASIEAEKNWQETANKIDVGQSRDYEDVVGGEQTTWKNLAYLAVNQLPPEDEHYTFVNRGKVYDTRAWFFIGPDGERGANDLLLLLAEIFSSRRGVKAWTDIGIGPDDGKYRPRHHLSTPLADIQRAKDDLHEWRERPSAEGILDAAERNDEPIWFVVNLGIERGTEAETRFLEFFKEGSTGNGNHRRRRTRKRKTRAHKRQPGKTRQHARGIRQPSKRKVATKKTGRKVPPSGGASSVRRKGARGAPPRSRNAGLGKRNKRK